MMITVSNHLEQGLLGPVLFFTQDKIDKIAEELSDATDNIAFPTPLVGYDKVILPILNKYSIKKPNTAGLQAAGEDGELWYEVGTLPDDQKVHLYIAYYRDDHMVYGIYADLMNDIDRQRYEEDLNAPEWDEYFEDEEEYDEDQNDDREFTDT
jgi:hypothetical protein